MRETFETSDLATSLASTNTISLPVSAFGPEPLATPSGPAPFGRGRALVNLSPRQAKAQGLLTSGTYGLTGTGLLSSALLSRLLASKLRALTDILGSTLFKLTWKDQTTPAGRLLPLLRASARRTGDTGFIGWPTPCTQDGPKGGPSQGTDRLPAAAALAPWPTTMSRDFKHDSGKPHPNREGWPLLTSAGQRPPGHTKKARH